MLKKLNKPLISLLLLLTVYNFFFWREMLGINIVIFTLLFIGAMLWINPGALKSRNAIMTLLAAVYCCIMVLLNNSVFSKLTLITDLMLFTGFVHQPEIKSIFASCVTYISSNCLLPVTIIEGFIKSKNGNKGLRFTYNVIKLGTIPVLIFIIFYAMYAVANTKFGFYGGKVLNEIGIFLNNILSDYPFIRFMFIFLGFILLGGTLYNRNIDFFKNRDISFLDKLLRNRENKLQLRKNGARYFPYLKSMNIITPRINSLVNECRVGIIILGLVNILILGLNIVDIKFLWLNFDPSEIQGFSDYVHEGTYLLIFSIVLSMIILLYFFRANLNFYSKNRTLKILSFIWIAQNVFMALSVGLRNHYYILYTHTISYKKIGVIVYLLLTLTGLITMAMKIMQKRSTYNIFKINSWAVVVVFLLMSSFNWDKNIAMYNLANPVSENIDVAYLLELGDDILPELDKRKDLLNKEYYIPRSYRVKKTNPLEYFYKRKEKFMNEWSLYSWLSWNLADHNTYKYF